MLPRVLNCCTKINYDYKIYEALLFLLCLLPLEELRVAVAWLAGSLEALCMCGLCFFGEVPGDNFRPFGEEAREPKAGTLPVVKSIVRRFLTS